MSTDSDISWQLLRGIVRDWAGTSAELAEVTPLQGGSIHTTLALTTKDAAKAVLKITPHRVDRGYVDEAHQLALLKSLDVPVPEVYACHLGSLDSPNSYILMQFVDGVCLAESKRRCTHDEFDQVQAHLAELILKIHACRSPTYARVSTHDAQSQDAWPAFYRDLYDPIWSEAEKVPQLPVKAKRLIAKIHGRLDRLIANDDPARLTHWDLWSGNLVVKPDHDGRWRINAVLDPNCKFAHAEAELAYMDLFNTSTPAFTKTYQRERKLPADYHRVRKLVYQLYPLINDVTLHGEQYVKPLLTQVEKLSAVI